MSQVLPAGLLAQLRQHKIELRPEGNQLHVRAPKGALTAELRALITTHKAALIELLTASGSPGRQELALSEGQRALWYLSQLAPESNAYNVSVALLLRGSLSVESLQAALRRLGELHPLLRVRFQTQDGVPVMHIECSSQLTAEISDSQQLSAAEVQARAQALSERPFQLSAGATRVVLLVRSPSEAVLLLSVHHIIVDYWSLSTLVSDLFALYRSERQQSPREKSAQGLTYADFVAWQRRFLRSPEGTRQRDYWHKRLAGKLPVLDLPTDYPRPALRGEHGDSVHGFVDQQLTGQLRRLAAAEKTTPFAVVASALTALFYHYTGQPEILLGTPYHGRVQKDYERVVGFFVNFLVLRAHLRSDMSFGELIHQTHTSNLEALANPDYPFSLLVETLCPQRDASRNPLYQITIDWMAASDPLLTLSADSNTQYASLVADLQVAALNLRQLDGVSDQIWMLVDLGDRLAIKLGYNTDLFKAETVSSMLQHFLRILEQGLTQPGRRISALALMTQAEQEFFLAAPGKTAAQQGPPPRVIELFAAQVDRTPAAVALQTAQLCLTYRELDERANQLAHLLRNRGLRLGDPVSLYLDEPLDLIVGVLASLKAGGACVLLDTLDSFAHANAILADLGDSWLVTTTALQARLAAARPGRVLCLDVLGTELQQADNARPHDQFDPAQLACIMYSSEGEPPLRGALFSQAAIAAGVGSAVAVWKLTSGSRVLLQTGRSVSEVLFDILTTLCSGGILVAVAAEPVAGSALSQLLVTAEVQTLTATAMVVASLPVQEVPSLRTIVAYGTPSASGRFKHLSEKIRVVSAYGPRTEAPYAAAAELCRAEMEAMIGHPLIHSRLLIMDEQRRPVAPGILGELWVGGPGVACGYHRQEALTAQHFVTDHHGQRWFRTGVLARCRHDGAVQYKGLIHDAGRVAGNRAEGGRSEAVLLSHPAVKDCVVIPFPEQPGPSHTVAYVTPAQAQVSAAELLYFMRAELPAPTVPATIRLLDRMPLTRLGTIELTALSAAAAGGNGTAGADYVAPRDQLEQLLTHIWESVLKTQPVGIHDDFFSLGGHSLLAAQVRAQVKTQLQKDFPLATLVQAGTVERLAEFLRRDPGPNEQSALVLLRPGTRRPLFLIHPVGGNVLCYVELARRLDPGVTVYGLQSPALERDGVRPETMEELAAYYVAAIRARQSDGPYRVAGWSFGGIVAFEIAQQLTRQGAQVELLAIIDSVPPAMLTAFNAMDDVEVASWLQGQGQVSAEVAGALPAAEPGRTILADMAKRGLLPDPTERRLLDQLMRVYRHHGQLLRSYAPCPFPGRILLFLATGRWHMPSLAESATAWQALCKDLVETQPVPGDHFSILLGEQSLELIARTMMKALMAG